ncbi:DNA-binding MarR family transcriptional regulator [Streptomyces sp. SAI-133]|uniref:MarR family winged helix-turn-helix transcriptional regulator n=1 Tax=Streptomyces sp. SAI-133 TaxID=2940547 RepID=UPI0024749F09|nr:MarR family transcriptional regulator [Streptomyces sp. SAI-133]MDH6581697.1 DNA-binding MarR family transcriptional regulator [Streptomyces sp. SAI-133]
MATTALHEELAHQLTAVAGVRRELGRIVPPGCSAGCATTLAVLSRHGAVNIGQLTELLGIDMSVTSRYIAQLTMLNWVDRRPDPADRRSRILRLTSEGRARLAELSERRATELAARMDDWSEEDIRRLVALLSRLHAAFDSGRAGPRAYAGQVGDVHPAETPAA